MKQTDLHKHLLSQELKRTNLTCWVK